MMIRPTLRVLSAIAPGIAARVAARLWFRIPSPRVGADAEAFLATGEKFELEAAGARVAAWRWGKGPAIVLVHGWGGYAAQLRSFVEPLTRAGYQVITFDAPSHGASTAGKLGAHYATLFDFSDTLLAVTQNLPEVAGIVAHSGGCAATAWAITRNPRLRVHRLVFVAPFGGAARYMAYFQKQLGLSDEAMRRFRESTERQFDFEWKDFEVPDMPAAMRVATPQLLVVHDKGDRETSWQDGADIAAKWQNARLETTEGLGHNRILRDEKTVAKAVAFLTS